jgi:hypothetical protein
MQKIYTEAIQSEEKIPEIKIIFEKTNSYVKLDKSISEKSSNSSCDMGDIDEFTDFNDIPKNNIRVNLLRLVLFYKSRT